MGHICLKIQELKRFLKRKDYRKIHPNNLIFNDKSIDSGSLISTGYPSCLQWVDLITNARSKMKLNRFQFSSAFWACILILLLTAGCSSLKSENEKLKGEITDINAENEKLRSELNILKTENSKMHVTVAQLHLEIASLYNEIQSMQKDLESFKTQLKEGDKKNRRT